jgi:hypothetical protein
MPFRTPIQEIERNLKRLVIEKVREKKSEIELWSAWLAKAEYSSYNKHPIATGESREETKTTVKTDLRSLTANLEYKIGNDSGTRAKVWKNGAVDDYSIFFLEPQSPKNPNYKYGKRNPMKDSYEKHFKEMLNTILNS